MTVSPVESVEQLRERAFELEFALNKERAARRESEALLDGLRRLAFGSSADQILHETLDQMVRSTDAEGAFLLLRQGGDAFVCVAATDSTDGLFDGTVWMPQSHFERALSGQVSRLFDLESVPEWQAQAPELSARYGSALTLPLNSAGEQALLISVHSERAHFSTKAAKTAKRMAVLASDGLRLVRDREETLRGRLRQLTNRSETVRTQLLVAAAEALGEGLLVTDQDNRLVVCNEAYRKIYDQSADLYQPGCDVIAVFEQEVRAGFILDAIGQEDAWLAARLSDGLNDEVSEHSLANGRSVRVSSRRLPNGWTVGMRLDISELKRNEARIASALDQAERANAAKSRFLATVSHEIRTPLNAVTGLLGVLAQESLGAQQLEYVTAARSASGRLMSLLNDILDLAKMEAGHIELDDEVIVLSDLLDDVERLFASALAEKQLTLTCSVELSERDDGQVAVRGDGGRIRQILVNYLSNAIKFTARGGQIALSIGRSETASDQLRFRVADGGHGISEIDRERLFQPFSQLDNAVNSHAGGTGLGLSIVHELSVAMGGRSGVDGNGLRWTDEAGTDQQGAAFWVDLPLPLEDAPAIVGLRTGNSADDHRLPAREALRERLKGRRLLAADDSSSNLLLLRALFSGFDLVLDCVGDGREALDALQQASAQAPYDLVLMDISMPVMDGLEACRRIRALEGDRDQRTPMVALTAAVMTEERARVQQAGFDAFVAKPIDEASLLSTLFDLLPSDDQSPEDPIALIIEALGDIDPAQKQALLAALSTEFSQRLSILTEARQTRESSALKLQFHAIKGTAMSFGLRGLAEQAAALEQRCALATNADETEVDWQSVDRFNASLADTVRLLQT